MRLKFFFGYANFGTMFYLINLEKTLLKDQFLWHKVAAAKTANVKKSKNKT